MARDEAKTIDRSAYVKPTIIYFHSVIACIL